MRLILELLQYDNNIPVLSPPSVFIERWLNSQYFHKNINSMWLSIWNIIDYHWCIIGHLKKSMHTYSAGFFFFKLGWIDNQSNRGLQKSFDDIAVIIFNKISPFPLAWPQWVNHYICTNISDVITVTDGSRIINPCLTRIDYASHLINSCQTQINHTCHEFEHDLLSSSYFPVQIHPKYDEFQHSIYLVSFSCAWNIQMLEEMYHICMITDFIFTCSPISEFRPWKISNW